MTALRRLRASGTEFTKRANRRQRVLPPVSPGGIWLGLEGKRARTVVRGLYLII